MGGAFSNTSRLNREDDRFMRLVIADYLSEKTMELSASLIKSNIQHQLLVLSDKGNITEGILNPYLYFTGIANYKGRALQFNEIKVPPLYEIRHYNATKAVIIGEGIQRGFIYYFEEGQRTVNRVDWLNLQGERVFSDVYAQNGLCFAKISYTSEGKEAQKTFYNQQGQVVIVRDMFTNTIELSLGNKKVFFENVTAFAMAYIEELQETISDLYINSLSYPLFIANRLQTNTTLFWQEKIQSDIPGNMKIQLEEQQCVKRIVFESLTELEKVKQHYPNSKTELCYLAPIFDTSIDVENDKRNYHKALIVTASDNIHLIHELLEMLPTLEITIAAKTDMSSKLTNLANKYNNVHLYPHITDVTLEELTLKHTLYFDFNEGYEVDSIILNLFKKNYLIFAIDKVAKKQQFEMLFAIDNKTELLQTIKRVLIDQEYRERLLKKQQEKDGPRSQLIDYQKILLPN